MHHSLTVIFSSSTVVSRAFSALCVYSMFGIILIPWATFMPNFVSFATSVAELAHGENCILSQSLNHSPSLLDALETEALALCKKFFICKNSDIAIPIKWHPHRITIGRWPLLSQGRKPIWSLRSLWISWSGILFIWLSRVSNSPTVSYRGNDSHLMQGGSHHRLQKAAVNVFQQSVLHQRMCRLCTPIQALIPSANCKQASKC